MIAYKYIDTKGATIAAIRDYKNMEVIIENTPEKIKNIYEDMLCIKAININDLPQKTNINYQEDKIVKSLDAIGILQQRYENALEYMKWFKPAWNSLNELELDILREFYLSDNLRSGACSRLSRKYNYSQSQIDRKRSKAVYKLSRILFGI